MFWSLTLRPIYKRVLIAVAAILSVVILVPLFSYCRFGADPHLAYGILENCETAVLKLVKSAADMRLLRVLVFPGGLET